MFVTIYIYNLAIYENCNGNKENAIFVLGRALLIEKIKIIGGLLCLKK